MGLALTAGGAWLLALGGSWYYLLDGLALLATAGFLLARSSWALLLYALVLAGTLAWAWSEAGLDLWPLAARGSVILLVGLFLAHALDYPRPR
jgi:quinoprotein glucose dehydrogenase